MFELLFYVIGDMSVKSIVKFVVSFALLLKISTNYLKNVIFYKILDFLLRKWPFSKWENSLFVVGLKLSCQGLEPALLSNNLQRGSKGRYFKTIL